MIEDRPISADEATLLALINKYSGGDPYKMISYDQVRSADWASISTDAVRGIIEDYMSSKPIDYIRLRWFYRRLSQIGHPGAIDVSLACLDELGPCFSNICFYLASVQSVPPAAWKKIGARLLQLLRLPEVKSNEYFRLSILSLFGRNADINHFSRLVRLFQGSDPFVRREIILAARANGAHDWLRELKESFPSMDPWQQSAYIFAISGLPKEERKFFVNRWPADRPFSKTLAKWAKVA